MGNYFNYVLPYVKLCAVLLLKCVFIDGQFRFCHEGTWHEITGEECKYGIYFNEPVITPCYHSIGSNVSVPRIWPSPCDKPFVSLPRENNEVKTNDGNSILAQRHGEFQFIQHGERGNLSSLPSRDDVITLQECMKFECHMKTVARRDDHESSDSVEDQNSKIKPKLNYTVVKQLTDQTLRLGDYLYDQLIEQDPNPGPELRIVRLFKKTMEVMRRTCQHPFLPDDFATRVLYGFLFLVTDNGIGQIDDVTNEEYEDIMDALKICADTPRNFRLEGKACNMISTVEQVIKIDNDGNELVSEFKPSKLPGEKRKFPYERYDIIVESAWQAVQVVHGSCFATFRPNANMHHRYTAAMEQLFGKKIMQRWRYPTQLIDPKLWGTWFLADVDSTYFNSLACVRASYEAAPFAMRLDRPIDSNRNSDKLKRKKRSSPFSSIEEYWVNYRSTGGILEKLPNKLKCFTHKVDRNRVFDDFRLVNCPELLFDENEFGEQVSGESEERERYQWRKNTTNRPSGRIRDDNTQSEKIPIPSYIDITTEREESSDKLPIPSYIDVRPEENSKKPSNSQNESSAKLPIPSYIDLHPEDISDNPSNSQTEYPKMLATQSYIDLRPKEISGRRSKSQTEPLKMLTTHSYIDHPPEENSERPSNIQTEPSKMLTTPSYIDHPSEENSERPSKSQTEPSTMLTTPAYIDHPKEENSESMEWFSCLLNSFSGCEPPEENSENTSSTSAPESNNLSWTVLDECECGMRNGNSVTPRVVGGVDTLPYEFPWMVLIRVTKGTRGKATCAATIISDRLLLTAAHCIYLETVDEKKEMIAGPNILLPPESVEAHFHIYSPRKEVTEYKQTGMRNYTVVNVTKIIPHPGYSLDTTNVPKADWHENDVALLVLEERLDITNPDFNPVCLPQQDDKITLSPGKYATLIGWGHTIRENGTSSTSATNLQKLRVPLQDEKECLRLVPGKKLSHYICGDVGDATGAAPGDSGGPIVVELPSHHLLQIGTVSHGEDDNPYYNGSTFSRISFYYRLTAVLDWIVVKGTEYGVKTCKRKSKLPEEIPSYTDLPPEENSEKTSTTPAPESNNLSWTVLDECECGMSMRNGKSVTPRVVGGVDTLPYEFPWIVLLRITKGTIGKATCAATIISDRLLLTAAHCIYLETVDEKKEMIAGPNILLTPESVEAHFHIYSPRKEVTEYKQTGIRNYTVVNVTKIIPHPGYYLDTTNVPKADWYENDVALLVLEERLDITNPDFNPVCLPQKDDKITLSPGKYATLIGWGHTIRENGTSSTSATNLQKLQVPLQDEKECLRLVPGKKLSHYICGDVGDATGAAPGDSGGPIVVDLPSQHLLQIGTLSHGEDENPYYNGSTFSRISFYYRLSAVLDWIVMKGTEYGVKTCKRKSNPT